MIIINALNAASVANLTQLSIKRTTVDGKVVPRRRRRTQDQDAYVDFTRAVLRRTHQRYVLSRCSLTQRVSNWGPRTKRVRDGIPGGPPEDSEK